MREVQLLKEKRFYDFKNFRLDREEKILLRGGDKIPLTPKAFHLLDFLIERRGRIIEKDELMAEIWADSFVEQGNLTFTIRQLRIALGDDAHNPVYVETVPRRGYRFIAEVTETSADTDFKNDATPAAVENALPIENKAKPVNYLIPVSVIGILLIGAIITVSWYAKSKNLNVTLNVLSAPFSSEKISSNGKVFNAVITPDGKNVIYTNKAGGKQSVWIRQLESANNVEIIPASDDVYAGLAVSPDGNFLYFSRMPKGKSGQLDIYRISIFGGIPDKLVDETQGWIGVSPDGTKISFVRCYYREDENCSLWIADGANGKNQKKIAARKPPLRIADNEFSTDGKTVAFAVGQSENAANEFSLAEADIETGAEREITKEKFFNIKGLTQLPDQSGLLITASRIPNKNFQIWRVSADSGAVEPLTNDSQTYSVLSLDKAANLLVSTNIREDFYLNLLNIENSAQKKILVDASSADFTSDGRIIFSSATSGNEEIWSINADGSGQKQLTNDTSDDFKPILSSADNSVYFASNRSGAVQIWRMNSDGSNQMQITENEGGFPLLVSPDGAWIYCQHGMDRTLRRSSKDGGEVQMIWNKPAYRFAVSPDGKQAAFAEKKGDGRILKIISTADKSVIETFQPAIVEHKMPEIAWMPDGKSLVYILMDKNHENYSLWLQPFGTGQPQKIADLGDDEIAESSGFAVSPDGKSLMFIQGGWRHDAVLIKGLK